MGPEEYATLLGQHLELLGETRQLLTILIVLVFVQVLGVFVMIGLAAWSVATVLGKRAARA